MPLVAMEASITGVTHQQKRGLRYDGDGCSACCGRFSMLWRRAFDHQQEALIVQGLYATRPDDVCTIYDMIRHMI